MAGGWPEEKRRSLPSYGSNYFSAFVLVELRDLTREASPPLLALLRKVCVSSNKSVWKDHTSNSNAAVAPKQRVLCVVLW